jgi:carbamoyltransferase
MAKHTQDGPVRILGISAHYHDSAAALVVDGKIVAAAQEERFTRVKGDSALPERAVEYALQAGGLSPDELTAVAYYENPFAKFDRQLNSHLIGRPGALPGFVQAMRATLSEKLWVESEIRRLLGRRVPVLLGDHHLSHAVSAFIPSPFEEAATLTVDGVGEWSTTTIGVGSGGRVDLLEQIEFPNSLGLLYSVFTAYCGFKVNSGEYKLMGLAPYGTPRFVDLILEEFISLHADGSFSLNPRHFAYLDGGRTYRKSFEAVLGERTRRPETAMSQFHADVAASIQEVTNRAMLGLARRARERSGSTRLVLAGGVALNVVSVGHLQRSGLFEDIWVQPAAGDAGGALGSALWASHQVYGVPRAVQADDAMAGAFLGPTPSQAGTDVESLLSEYGVIGHRLDDSTMAETVARSLADGQIVAVARGRMEFGPRALGARSVLADARSPQMQSRLNLKTKFREGFRPFAPLVLADRADEYFDMGGESPYMLKTFPVRAELRTDATDDESLDFTTRVNRVRSTIPAVTHVDHSARVQTVDAQRNPFTHTVLSNFADITGTAVLVNTSFNVRGEPIVCSSDDALECFLATDIDVLVLEDHLIRRSEQPESVRPLRSTAVRAD